MKILHLQYIQAHINILVRLYQSAKDIKKIDKIIKTIYLLILIK